jgi:hypothetical protein
MGFLSSARILDCRSSPAVRWLALGLLCITPLIPASAAGPAASTGTLRILWEQDLPPYATGPAMDVRWAGDRSLYLAWTKEGVTEVALDGSFTRQRSLVIDPGRHFRDFEILGVSADYLVASSRFNYMALRPGPAHRGDLSATARVPIAIVEDLDLSGSRLLLLGNPGFTYPSAGTVAWLGPASNAPARDLKPLPIVDPAGAQSKTENHFPSLTNCSELELGAARFLADGSLFVVPGFSPGAYHLTPKGRLIQTWDTQALGLDAAPDCASMTAKERLAMSFSDAPRFDFINRHRVVDEVLPLVQGPGLLIRSVSDGAVHWELEILRPGGGLLTYQIPFTGTLPYDRLRGDVRDHRIVLLRSTHGFERGKPFKVAKVFVAELPPPRSAKGDQP